jgi:hypothetical protein
MANHLNPGGHLIAGFQLLPGRLKAGHYDEIANTAGLTIAERWSTWDRDPWSPDDAYTVLVHIK